MNKAVIALFENTDDLEQAVTELQDIGFNAKEISIAMKDKVQASRIEENTDVGVATGAAAGATTGALTNLGLSDQEAEYYQTRIGEGASLIAVPVQEHQELQVSAVLEFHSAVDIKILGGDMTSSSSLDDLQETGGVYRRKSYAYVGAKGGASDEDEDEDLDDESDDEDSKDKVESKDN